MALSARKDIWGLRIWFPASIVRTGVRLSLSGLIRVFVEYRFPTHILKSGQIQEVSFSFEVCSEAPGYQNDWPSDITVWVNGQEIVTMTLSGDFGGRRGRLNPEWWSDTMTQYGMYKAVKITESGCYENDIKCSDFSLETLEAEGKNYISFKLGVKPGAAHVGGMNLFGERLGIMPRELR